MLFALAVLMFQSAASPAPLPAIIPDSGVSPVATNKIDTNSAAAAANAQVNPALANLPIARTFSGAWGMMLEQSAPLDDDKATQKTAPAAGDASANASGAQANFPVTQTFGSFMPGQLEPVETGESSSRADGSSTAAAASAPASFKPAPYSRVSETGRVHGFPKNWMILGAVEHGAATFDAWSTRRVIENGTGYEMNPLLKPFANSNALYGAVQVAPLVFDYVGLRMLHSEHPWMRKFWWVPQSASAAASIFGGVHNTMMH